MGERWRRQLHTGLGWSWRPCRSLLLFRLLCRCGFRGLPLVPRQHGRPAGFGSILFVGVPSVGSGEAGASLALVRQGSLTGQSAAPQERARRGGAPRAGGRAGQRPGAVAPGAARPPQGGRLAARGEQAIARTSWRTASSAPAAAAPAGGGGQHRRLHWCSAAASHSPRGHTAALRELRGPRRPRCGTDQAAARVAGHGPRRPRGFPLVDEGQRCTGEMGRHRRRAVARLCQPCKRPALPLWQQLDAGARGVRALAAAGRAHPLDLRAPWPRASAGPAAAHLDLRAARSDGWCARWLQR
mmetsp:Transcript_159201/g.487155  ORF Transcript_159201/g.487155 Transcript_159201/m.487155 type:complete len:299 (+) Transcript_159201:75-971(+)